MTKGFFKNKNYRSEAVPRVEKATNKMSHACWQRFYDDYKKLVVEMNELRATQLTKMCSFYSFWFNENEDNRYLIDLMFFFFPEHYRYNMMHLGEIWKGERLRAATLPPDESPTVEEILERSLAINNDTQDSILNN